MKERNVITHYSINDLAYGIFLEKAIEIGRKIISQNDYDLLDILNLFEINLYLEDYNLLNETGQNLLKQLIEKKCKINLIIGRYFNNVNESNLIQILLKVKDNYYAKNTLLKCFDKYKVIDRINEETFKYVIDNDLLFMIDILHYKRIVKKYELIIKNKLLEDNKTAELLVKIYDYKTQEQIFLPNLSIEEKKKVITDYLSSDWVNINCLKAMECHIDNDYSYRLTPEHRLTIKKLIKEKGEEILESGVTLEHKLVVNIDRNADDIVSQIVTNDKFVYTIPGKWIDNNLDYPTLMNNFIYVLEYFDIDMNFNGLANINKEGVFTRHILKSNSTNYVTGYAFKIIEGYKNLSFCSYVNYLKQVHNIDIEDVIEWFFNEYIPKEFNISNFNISLSTDKKFVIRCKALFPEFDSVLKKFKLYIEYGTISNELLEATKESFKIEDCPSLINEKYLIINKENQEIKIILNLLFSDQSDLAYINEHLKDSNFANLIIKNQVNINDCDMRDLRCIEYLIDKEIVYLDNNIIKIKKDVFFICKSLHENNFIRNHHFDIEKKFIEKGYLIPYTRLFAPEEADYLNYILNNSKYGDALAISNTYRHGNTTLEDEEKILNDYLIGLRMLILVIVKINDELCKENTNF